VVSGGQHEEEQTGSQHLRHPVPYPSSLSDRRTHLSIRQQANVSVNIALQLKLTQSLLHVVHFSILSQLMERVAFRKLPLSNSGCPVRNQERPAHVFVANK
jgi:hypothetical protein